MSTKQQLFDFQNEFLIEHFFTKIHLVMQKIIAKLFLPLAMIGLMIACQKEHIETTQNYTEATLDLRDATDDPSDRCFTFVFPVTVVWPDGTSATFETQEAFVEGVLTWRAANPGARILPNVQLPVDVTLSDGSTSTISTAAQLHELQVACGLERLGKGHRILDCYKPVFPFTLVFPDSSTQSVNDREEMQDAIASWRTANPSTPGVVHIQFPYDVRLQDSTVITVYSKEDIDAITADCDFAPPYGPCVRIIFPIMLNYPDGTGEEIADLQSLRDAIDTWNAAHPDDTTKPEIAFPHEIELPNGSTVTVENKEQLAKFLRACREQRPFIPNLLDNACYQVIFPVTIDFSDGSSLEIAGYQAYLDFLQAWHKSHAMGDRPPHIAFPFEVLINATNTVVTVENAADLAAIVARCIN